MVSLADALKPQIAQTAVHDYCNGRKDLRGRLIRMTGSKVFDDDPLRLMRAFSLSAVLGFRIECKTRALIKRKAALVTRASAERIREELIKVCNSPLAYDNLLGMDAVGVLALVILNLT